MAEESRLPRNELGTRPVALREALNVDLDPAGNVRRRTGYALSKPGTLIHSLWAPAHAAYGYFVDDGRLKLVDPQLEAHDLNVAVGNRPMSYCELGGSVFYSNGDVSGQLQALTAIPWATEQPAGAPSLASGAAGALPPGKYQFAITFTDVEGRESGASPAVTHQHTSGGIAATAVPQPLQLGIIGINVYMTTANGTELRRATSLSPGQTSVDLVGSPNGRVLATTFLEPMPAGQCVAGFNGRLYVARGNLLLWSEPLRYGLFRRATNYMAFPAPIDLLAPFDKNGLFVASGSKTYYLSGADPARYEFNVAYGAGAVPGSLVDVPGVALGLSELTQPHPVWLTRDGYIVFGTQGRVVVLKGNEAVIDDAERAAPLFRVQEGLQQLVMGLRAPSPQGLAVTDRAVAHVIHEDRQ